MKKQQFAVIGLGRFGGAICQELIDLGMEVLVIDSNEERVNEFASIATHAVIADSTDETVLKNLGIRNFDHVIVAIGENIQASILTTLILKDLGVRNVTVKAQNDLHAKVLHKIGADYVAHPERDMGRRIAHFITSKSILDYLELSDEYSIVEFQVTEQLAGDSLKELDIRAKYGITVVAIKRGDEIIVTPSPTDPLRKGDILIVIGENTNINKFENNILK